MDKYNNDRQITCCVTSEDWSHPLYASNNTKRERNTERVGGLENRGWNNENKTGNSGLD